MAEETDKKEKEQNKEQNPMRNIRMAELTLNCGATGEKLERAIKLLRMMTSKEPVKTLSKRRIPSFDIRPGLQIGCKVTLRGKEAETLLRRLLEAIGNQLSSRQVGQGQLSFGIHEYIEIPGVQFSREIGILGFDVSVNLARAGSKIAKRKSRKGHIPLRHKITKEETEMFMQTKFNTKILEGKK